MQSMAVMWLQSGLDVTKLNFFYLPGKSSSKEGREINKKRKDP
jgi:hypothetical protein